MQWIVKKSGSGEGHYSQLLNGLGTPEIHSCGDFPLKRSYLNYKLRQMCRCVSRHSLDEKGQGGYYGASNTAL